jgi:hypothetical protein
VLHSWSLCAQLFSIYDRVLASLLSRDDRIWRKKIAYKCQTATKLYPNFTLDFLSKTKRVCAFAISHDFSAPSQQVIEFLIMLFSSKLTGLIAYTATAFAAVDVGNSTSEFIAFLLGVIM